MTLDAILTAVRAGEMLPDAAAAHIQALVLDVADEIGADDFEARKIAVALGRHE